MIQVRDRYFMDIARTVRQGSKCRRAQFGSVLVRPENGRIVATAYNGKPAGACNDGVCYREGLPPNAPKRNCCVHSEKNAIIFSSPEERQGAWMYVTGMPCEDCSLDLMQSGIVRLVYLAVEDGSHPGWVGAPIEQLFEEYGFRGGGIFQRQIEVVRYTDAEWEQRYGERFTVSRPPQGRVRLLGDGPPSPMDEDMRLVQQQIAHEWNAVIAGDREALSPEVKAHLEATSMHLIVGPTTYEQVQRLLQAAREKRMVSEPE